MPYVNEYANKSSHSDIIKNPDVFEFLSECAYLREPSEEQIQNITSKFISTPVFEHADLPKGIIAVDGSLYEAQVNSRIPNTQLGYVKIGSLYIDLDKFNNLKEESGRFVDPFKVAKLKDDNDSLTFTLPSANVRWRDSSSVKTGFRAAIDMYLHHEKTRFVPSDPNTSLRSTLFHLATLRERGLRAQARIKLHKCPNDLCTSRTQPDTEITVTNSSEKQFCPYCNIEIFPSDCLRLWEHIVEFRPNKRAITLFMMVVEHLLPIHYIRYLKENSLASLSSMAFFIDSPLALFDVTAWLTGPIMKFLYDVNRRLLDQGYARITMIGLQKSGQVVDHVELIKNYIPKDSIYAIEDEYRYEYILDNQAVPDKGFGAQSYYGQDFIYKTPSGRVFVFGLPFPFSHKKMSTFNHVKTRYTIYNELSSAVTLINHFEIDLYENAVVPIALAHKYTSISLVPGGRVLDLLSQRSFRKKRVL